MRYMMLIYTKEGDLGAMPAEEAQQIRQNHSSVIDETRKRGMLVAVNSLGRTDTATTVRVENGKVLTIDGPFAETKEQLGGFILIEARDMDEAVELASKVPMAKHGSIEVRPVMETSAKT